MRCKLELLDSLGRTPSTLPYNSLVEEVTLAPGRHKPTASGDHSRPLSSIRSLAGRQPKPMGPQRNPACRCQRESPEPTVGLTRQNRTQPNSDFPQKSRQPNQTIHVEPRNRTRSPIHPAADPETSAETSRSSLSNEAVVPPERGGTRPGTGRMTRLSCMGETHLLGSGF